jgi:hypothetical protein
VKGPFRYHLPTEANVCATCLRRLVRDDGEPLDPGLLAWSEWPPPAHGLLPVFQGHLDRGTGPLLPQGQSCRSFYAPGGGR